MPTNSEIAARFFVSPKREAYFPADKNCGFEGDVFKSFNTPIAMLVPTRKGQSKVCVIWENPYYRHNIDAHINLLRNLSPYKVIQLPYAVGNNCPRFEDSIKRLAGNLAFCLKQYGKPDISSWHANYYRQEIRRLFNALIEIHIRICPLAVIAKHKDKIKEIL